MGASQKSEWESGGRIMTDFFAKDNGLVCTNPRCKDCGKTHPNCQCYDGGQVGFYDGGQVLGNWDDAEIVGQPQDEAPTEGGQVLGNWDDAEIVNAEPERTQKSPTDYESPLQTIAAGAEGAGRGFAGPVFTGLEMAANAAGVPGMTPEDIKGREEGNPLFSGLGEMGGTVGSYCTGIGEAAFLNKAVGMLPKLANANKWAKAGMFIFKSLATNAALASGDELSKAMLNVGNPEVPTSSASAHIGILGILGLVADTAFHGLGKVESIAAEKLGPKVSEYISGAAFGHGMAEEIGSAKTLIADLKESGFSNSKEFYHGIQHGIAVLNAQKNIFDKTIPQKIGKAVGTITGAAAGYIEHPLLAYPASKIGQFTGELLGKKLIKPLEPILGRISKRTQDIVGNTLLKLDGQVPTKFLNFVKYVDDAVKGEKLISDGVGSLFRSGIAAIGNGRATKANMDALDEHLKNPEPAPEPEESDAQITEMPEFAEGGEVQQQQPKHDPLMNGINEMAPEQNLLLHAAKGRITTYLKSHMPAKHPSKLTYDDEPDTTQQDHNYKEARAIALDPLSVLKHIRRGTIEPTHVAHLQAMYPDIHNRLSQEMTKHIVEGQVAEKRPPRYKVRQGMSLFLGTPLDSTMTPQAIQAIQATFAVNGQQQQGPQGQPAQGKPKNTKSSLTKMSQPYLMADEARLMREQQVSQPG